MIPRKELLILLRNRLQGVVPQEKIDQLTRDILALEGGWEEMEVSHRDGGYSTSMSYPDICWLADQVDQGAAIKLYRRKKLQAR